MLEEYARFGRHRLLWGSNLQNSLFFPCLTGKPNRCSLALRRPIQMAPETAQETDAMMLVLRIGTRKPACSQSFGERPETRDKCWGWVAEQEGFEPSIRGYRIHTFQACAFDHSATAPRVLFALPLRCLSAGSPGQRPCASSHEWTSLQGDPSCSRWAAQSNYGKRVALDSAARNGIPCERCLKNPFSPSKTCEKGFSFSLGLVRYPVHFAPFVARRAGVGRAREDIIGLRLVAQHAARMRRDLAACR